MIKNIFYFINWMFRVSYDFSVVKNKNLIDNSIFFTSIIFTDIIGIIINIIVYVFEFMRPKPYLYLIILIIVFILSKIYLSDRERLNFIINKKVDKKCHIIMFLLFFILQILFFCSLALIYNTGL